MFLRFLNLMHFFYRLELDSNHLGIPIDRTKSINVKHGLREHHETVSFLVKILIMQIRDYLKFRKINNHSREEK